MLLGSESTSNTKLHFILLLNLGGLKQQQIKVNFRFEEQSNSTEKRCNKCQTQTLDLLES